MLGSMAANGLNRKAFLLRKAKQKYTGYLASTPARVATLERISTGSPDRILQRHAQGMAFPLSALGRPSVNGMEEVSGAIPGHSCRQCVGMPLDPRQPLFGGGRYRSIVNQI